MPGYTRRQPERESRARRKTGPAMAVLFCQEALEYKVLEYKVYTSNLAVLIAQMAEALRPDILDESEKSNSWLKR